MKGLTKGFDRSEYAGKKAIQNLLSEGKESFKEKINEQKAANQGQQIPVGS